jgi:hypothetical protein
MTHSKGVHAEHGHEEGEEEENSDVEECAIRVD